MVSLLHRCSPAHRLLRRRDRALSAYVVVCRIRPSIHAAFQARAETVGATIDAVYDKLDGAEIAVSAELVHSTAARLAPVIDAMDGARAGWLPGYRVRILDGNHLAGTDHRIK